MRATISGCRHYTHTSYGPLPTHSDRVSNVQGVLADAASKIEVVRCLVVARIYLLRARFDMDEPYRAVTQPYEQG